MIRRIQNIFSNSKESVELIILKNSSAPFIDDNFFYISGLEQGLFEGCCAFLHPDGAVDLLVSELEAESARKSKADLTIYKNREQFRTELTNLVAAKKNIGVNARGLSHYEFNDLRKLLPQAAFVDVSDGFMKTRLIKDESEIQHIKHACTIADNVVNEIPYLIGQDMNESELAAEINYSLQNHGAEKPAFDTISSFGKNTAEPHYTHGATTLRQGDFILCDFGACWKKYNSDITRMFSWGKITTQQQEMYTTVLQAQQIALEAIKPGVKARDVHLAVNSFINATKFKGRFIHSTGHCLGLAVHDGVGLSLDNTMELQENMVLTVEPGVYIPGVGGVRIEDDIRVTQKGMQLLTTSSRDLIQLD